MHFVFIFFFFFNDTATTEIYTLSLHDALPISPRRHALAHEQTRVDEEPRADALLEPARLQVAHLLADRKSTRLNSSHSQISYAVFCLKKKKKKDTALNGTRPLCMFVVCVYRAR